MDELQRLRQENATLRAENDELRRRLAQLEHQLDKIRQRPKRTRSGHAPAAKAKKDRRRKGQRQHPGSTRPQPPPETVFIEHDVHPEQCPHCGSRALEPTGQFDEHLVADIPEPKVEWHRYRRHTHLCRQCQRSCQGAGELELPGAHIGPRARLLTCYARAHLGISLGKTQSVLQDFFGLHVSRAGLLGHLRWGGTLLAPVVEQLWQRLRHSPVVGADETGWRINGQPAWAWCFRDPQLALFLIDHSRSRAVLERALGTTFAGTLVSDFYAAYNRLECRKQRCLVHLLRELARLRDEIPWQSVRAFIGPLIDICQDALQLARQRADLQAACFAERREQIRERFYALLMTTRSRQPDCRRIYKRLLKHSEELFTFLDDARVPADNNGSERDIRSLAAARSDGGVHRADWSAAAFATLKSVIVTGLKNGLSFFRYGLDVVRARVCGEALPLPLASAPDSS